MIKAAASRNQSNANICITPRLSRFRPHKWFLVLLTGKFLFYFHAAAPMWVPSGCKHLQNDRGNKNFFLKKSPCKIEINKISSRLDASQKSWRGHYPKQIAVYSRWLQQFKYRHTATFNLIIRLRMYTGRHKRTHAHTKRQASKHNLKCKCNNMTRVGFEKGRKRLRKGCWWQKGREKQIEGRRAGAAQEDQKKGVKRDTKRRVWRVWGGGNKDVRGRQEPEYVEAFLFNRCHRILCSDWTRKVSHFPNFSWGAHSNNPRITQALWESLPRTGWLKKKFQLTFN